MRVTRTEIPDVLLVEPQVFGDDRGFFCETWSAKRYAEAGIPWTFVQDNLSRSVHGVLRGLHLQNPHGQGKLVQVVDGEVFDVAVDVRVDSPSFGRLVGYVLSANNRHQLFIPPGLAHGFCVTSPFATFAYKCTESYVPDAEMGIRYDDPSIGVRWPVNEPILSTRDDAWPLLRDIPRDRLPTLEGSRWVR